MEPSAAMAEARFGTDTGVASPMTWQEESFGQEGSLQTASGSC